MGYAYYVQPCSCAECMKAASPDSKKRLSKKDAEAARKAQEDWQEELKGLQTLWAMQEEIELHHQYEALLPERERAYANTVARLRRYK